MAIDEENAHGLGRVKALRVARWLCVQPFGSRFFESIGPPDSPATERIRADGRSCEWCRKERRRTEASEGREVLKKRVGVRGKLWVRSREAPVVVVVFRARRCGKPTSRLPRRRSNSGTTSNRCDSDKWTAVGTKGLVYWCIRSW